MENPPELVSPELVLVDPELAARVRTAGPVTDCLAPRPCAAPALPAAAPRPRMVRYRASRTGAWLRNAVLALSLCANAVLIASAWNGTPAPSAPPVTLVNPSLRVTGASSPSIGSAASSAGQTPPATAGERAALAALGKDPSLAKLFVDPATGAPFPDVSVHCTPVPPAGALRCVVERAADGGTIERAVSYRPGSGFQLTANR